MRYSNDKEIQTLVSRLVRAGWRYENGRHGKLRPPCGKGFITIPKTPSDWRAFRNLIRDINRMAASPGQGVQP